MSRLPLLSMSAALLLTALAPTTGEGADSPSQKRYRVELKTLREQSSAQSGKDDLASAEQTSQNALQLAERGFGPDSLETADALRNLVVIWQAQNDTERVEPGLKRILAIREHLLEPNHPDIANALSNLGRHYFFRGLYEQAEPPLARALKIREDVLGPKDLSVASSLHDLALLYKEEGRYAEAVPLMEREVLIWEQATDRDHPMLEAVLSTYADLLRKSENAKKADGIDNRVERLRRARQ